MVVNLNTSLLYQMYQKDTIGKNSDGVISQEDFLQNSSYKIEGNKVIITESDGDTFTYDLSAVSGNAGETADTTSDTDAAGTIGSGLTAEEAQRRSNVVPVNPTDKVDTVMVTSTNRTKEEIQADLDEVEKQQKEVKEQMAANSTEITRLKEENNKLYDEINSKISDYIEKSQDIAEERKEEVKKLTQQEITKFKNGEYKTKAELFEAIKTGAADIISQTSVNGLFSELDGLIDQAQTSIDANTAEISRLEVENTSLQATLDSLNIQEAKLQQELKLALEKCEPQGFAVENANGSTTQYDFFVDRDGNKDLTDASEFLGASRYEEGGQEGAWSEMTDLDTNSDGVVDSEELDAGNVMVVVTTIDANGNKTQKTVSAKEAFGENSDLAISTKQNATKSNSNAPANFNDEQYGGENTILGNFNVTLDGQNYTGYQTADSYDYLNDSYSFSSGSAQGIRLTDSYISAALAADSFDPETLLIDKDSAEKARDNANGNGILEVAESICSQNGIKSDNNSGSIYGSNAGTENKHYNLGDKLDIDFAA